MPVSYPVLRGPQIDTSNWLNAYRQGNEDRQQNEQRNLLKEIGADMAQNNPAGAAKRAYAGGAVDTGMALTKYSHGLDLQNQETQLKLLTFLGDRAPAADTPEKQDAVFKIMERVFGADKVAPLRGVPWDEVVAGFADEKSKLERQKMQADTESVKALTEQRRASAEYYRARPAASGGSSSGQTLAIVERLMKESGLTFEEALARTQRAPRDDTIARERLAVEALNAGGFVNLEAARRAYGLPSAAPAAPTASPQTAAPAASAPAGAPSPAAPAMAPPPPIAPPVAKGSGTQTDPFIPQTQADIDAAPPGSVFLIDGELYQK